MKKFEEMIRPFISIIFGALILIHNLNLLGTGIVLGVILGVLSIMVSLYYLVYGILTVVLGEKLPTKLRELNDSLAYTIFPGFLATFILIDLILEATYFTVGPAGWVIGIISVLIIVVFITMFLLKKAVKNELIDRLAKLMAFCVYLVMLFDILFSYGNAIGLGAIDVVLTVIYVIFGYMLFPYLELK